jgi:hypothetical protein
MNIQYLVDVLAVEASLLEATLRDHARLRPLFVRAPDAFDAAALRRSYLLLLKLKMDYVQYTVPALRAAGVALRGGDAEDRRWSDHLLDYATGETDERGGYGHDTWAREDLVALDAPRELIEAPPHPSAVLYGKYFIDEVDRHPYAVLGAKGVLEEFSVRISDDIVYGVIARGIASPDRGTQFFRHHGVLDLDHVRDGMRNLANLVHPDKRFQIVEGTYFTSGSYRTLVHHLLRG